MGTWGTGIRQDDFVGDVQDAFKGLLRDGDTLANATKSIRNRFKECLDDSEEGPLFWIALADIQWKYGELAPSILRKVVKIVESDSGMERWAESEKLYKRRKVVLKKFVTKISTPNPKPTKLPRASKTRVGQFPLVEGDCLSVSLDNGQFCACLVLAIYNSNGKDGRCLIGELDYLSDDPPTAADCKKRNWLKLTHNSWNGKVQISWVWIAEFKIMKPRISVVGNVPINKNDPKESRSYSNWTLVGEQILCQREWDEQTSG